MEARVLLRPSLFSEKMVMKKIMIKTTLVIMCVSVSAFLMFSDPAKEGKSSDFPRVVDTGTEKAAPLNIDEITNDSQRFINALSDQMRQKHAHEISQVLVQLSMADFRLFVLEEFPNDGDAVFQTVMRNAFPDYAEDIFLLLENMNLYNEWHVDILLTLNDMDSITRNGTLWGKRRELFGDLAEDIWQQELDESEAKQKSVQETISALQIAHDISLQDRLYILKDSIYQQYGDEHSNMLISKGMVADIYFHLDSVQADLKEMSEDDRASALAQSRRQLGFSDENIQDMAEQDAQKEIRWKNGYEYMSAREQLTSLYKGAELDEKLMALRVTFFEHEALTIQKEEQSDFFRYKRPRLYGSN